MKIFKEKKLIISILIITIAMIIFNYIFIKRQNEIYQNKVNIVIANMIGEITQKYPDISEEELIKILNTRQDSIKYGYSILEKYGISENNNSAIRDLEEQEKNVIKINIASIIMFLILMIILFVIYRNKQEKELNKIIKYIEQINNKNYELKIDENSEGELSNLKNELYKITVMLKEQAEKSLNDKKMLKKSLEDISHQLKTPLTSISIMLDNIIENPNMDEKTKNNFMIEISRQIEWINWLVISILKLSKLESNTVEFERKEIDVKSLVKDAIKNLAIPLDIKQQNITINGENATFYGDYNWQLEAITNVLKNCIEHSPENSTIYINFVENKFYTKISITDEGNGIDKEDIKHVFERFYKGKNSSSNSIGIGLALSKSIIEKDNGNITCFSKINEGTTFEIKYILT
mgnify:FL=1